MDNFTGLITSQKLIITECIAKIFFLGIGEIRFIDEKPYLKMKKRLIGDL